MPVLMFLVAGPYRSGTNDAPVLIARNVETMTDASPRLFRAGHLPVMGEWYALPLIEHAGSQRIGGPSVGADEMVALAREQGKQVFIPLDEVPRTG